MSRLALNTRQLKDEPMVSVFKVDERRYKSKS